MYQEDYLMKAKLAIIIGCLSIAMSGYIHADCGNGNCDGGYCDESQTPCQCTDPGCNDPWDTNCLSRSACCQAFGNVGAD